MNNVLYTTEENFEKDVLSSDKPTILDFYSDECPPCEQLAPAFDLMAQKYGHFMNFIKVFRQKNRGLAAKYEVKSSPTVLFIKDGEVVGKRLNGYIKKPQLRIAIEEILGDKAKEMPLKKVETDLLIFGAGIAGLSAAIYAKRAKLDTVVLDEAVPGGQIALTEHIANYPGVGEIIGGKKLAENTRNQAHFYGARIDHLKEIMEVNLEGSVKYCRTEDTEYFAKAVIIATGSEPAALPAENAEEFKGKGVHYCATCDGFMYEGKNIIVVGGGDAALEEAVYLTRFASQVTVINRSHNFRASKVIQEDAKHNPKIRFINNHEIVKINGEGHSINSVLIKDKDTNEVKELAADGVFVYIGMKPKTDIFSKQLKLNHQGYIEAGEDTLTNISGVFAAGDVRTKHLRQAITAASDGAVSAVIAEKYIANL